MITNIKYTYTMVFVLFALAGLLYANSGVGIQAITAPSSDVTLSFVQAGRIASIKFKEGDLVTKGQVLAQLDDAVEQVRLIQIKTQSENTSSVKAAEASLKQAQFNLEKLQVAAEHNAVTKLEVEQAKLNVTLTELSLDLAILEHEQAKLKYKEAMLQIDRMTVKSPIDGRIVELFTEVGESVNALQELVQVVRIDPLWIDVPIPLEKSVNLELGQKAKIVFSENGNITSQGTIIYISPVADPGSETLKIRLEAANKTGRPAGERVEIVLGD